MKNNPDSCPCGSGQTYGDCCQAFHLGKNFAPTAEKLMRSRYCAFAKCIIPYLTQTHHPSKRQNSDEAETLAWASSVRFTQLQIVDKSKGGIKDKQGMVEFIATYEDASGKHELHEKSRFVKDDKGHWLYLDAL